MFCDSHIKFADESDRASIRDMWKICFGDDDAYLDIYFSNKYKDQNTLVYYADGMPVASLQMLPFQFKFYQIEIPIYYLCGLCTLPLYRHRGFMSKLIEASHQIMIKRVIPLSILIPANNGLYQFYAKYNYEKVFRQGNDIIPLKSILSSSKNDYEAYQKFQDLYRDKDFNIQKSLADFKVILEEYRLDGMPDKTNLSAMASLIDPQYLLSIYASFNPNNEFSLCLNANKTFCYWIVAHGEVKSISKIDHPDIVVDIRMLCRLLFGYNIEQLGIIYRQNFPIHEPMINLMLE